MFGDMTAHRKDVSNHISNAKTTRYTKKSTEKEIICHRLDCRMPVVCRCKECEFYYCYDHVQPHPHSREKLEIIR